MKMTSERREYINHHIDAELTQEELNAGYHFCYEWDQALVGPDDDEYGFGPCCKKFFPLKE